MLPHAAASLATATIAATPPAATLTAAVATATLAAAAHRSGDVQSAVRTVAKYLLHLQECRLRCSLYDAIAPVRLHRLLHTAVAAVAATEPASGTAAIARAVVAPNAVPQPVRGHHLWRLLPDDVPRVRDQPRLLQLRRLLHRSPAITTATLSAAGATAAVAPTIATPTVAATIAAAAITSAVASSDSTASVTTASAATTLPSAALATAAFLTATAAHAGPSRRLQPTAALTPPRP